MTKIHTNNGGFDIISTVKATTKTAVLQIALAIACAMALPLHSAASSQDLRGASPQSHVAASYAPPSAFPAAPQPKEMRRLAASLTGCVVRVADGDTITILSPDPGGSVAPRRNNSEASPAQRKIRLYGIDAPESHQAFGQKSKQHLSSLAFGRDVTLQTAAAAVGVSDSRICDYLNNKDYEDNAWVLAARFWQNLCADPQQLSIVADIIRTKLHHKLATIDKIDALSLYTQILPHFIAGCGENPPNEVRAESGRKAEGFGIICAHRKDWKMDNGKSAFLRRPPAQEVPDR